MTSERNLVKFLLKIILVCSFAFSTAVFAQEGESAGEPNAEDGSEVPPSPTERVEPLFPRANRDLVFVEGEDAVSTNFNKEPILNYAASGSRTLQLNRITGLQAGAAFFADFVFYVEEEGVYELWYGGTPPGPREELYPAYASPFRYSFDDEEAADIYTACQLCLGSLPDQQIAQCILDNRHDGSGQELLDVCTQAVQEDCAVATVE